MEQFYHFGETTAAGILSVAPTDQLTIWSWLLIAAAMAVCIRVQKQSQRRLQPIPVLSRTRRPLRRAAPFSPRR
jgi:hypothetical protein